MTDKEWTDKEMDALLRSLPREDSQVAVDPASLAAIRNRILADVHPVKPLPSTAALALLFCLFFGIVVAVGSYFLGFRGLHTLSPLGSTLTCGLLLTLILAAAISIARLMRPGASQLAGWVLPVIAFVAFEALFLFILPDYSMNRFLPAGFFCLCIGVLCALPAALLSCLLVRRGYVVSPVPTGATVGVAAGLAGLTVIEFHCPIETFPHVAVWHVGIVLLSAAVGALAGALSRRLS